MIERRRPAFGMTRRLVLIAVALSPWLIERAKAAEPWPAKPIKWMVAYPAGGGSDFLARQLAPQLGKQLGQTIIIENRPGAAAIIGTDAAAKSAPDGYTMLSGDNGAMVFNTAMYKKLPYAPADFAPVGLMARFPLMLTAHPQAGFATAQQWLDAVKRNPGKYSYASPGIGSPHHLAMELIKERSKSFIVHVPYRGTAMAVQDLLAGTVPMAILDTAAGLPHVRSGKLKPLAVLSAKRLPQLPDVPTFAELGMKDVEVAAWQGLFVPKGTPEAITARLSTEMQKAIAQPEVRAKLEDFGLELIPSDAATLARFVQTETVQWHALIKERKLSAD